MSTQGAGWYDDGNGRKRWWDGRKWGALADAIEEVATSQTSISDAAKAAMAEARQSLPDLARQAISERYPAADALVTAQQPTGTATVDVPVPAAPPARAENPRAANREGKGGSARPKNAVTPKNPVTPKKPKPKMGFTAILALIAGVIALLTSFIPLFGALVGSLAIIIGLVALIRDQSKVISYVAIVMGTIAIFVSLLIGFAVWSAIG